MRSGFEQYDAALNRRLVELLAEYRERLPGVFRVASVIRQMTDGPVVMRLDPGAVFRSGNCEPVISEIIERLATEFGSDPHYFGLSIALPDEFLDQRARLGRRLDQERTNDHNRRIRLKESDHR